MSEPARPTKKVTPAEFIARQVREHLQGAGFRAQLYDIVRDVIAAQGVGATGLGPELDVDEVRRVVADALGAQDLAGMDEVRQLVAESAAQGGGDIGDVGALVDERIERSSQALEERLLQAIERRPTVEVPRPLATPALTDAMLQDIYRAAREEVGTLRRSLDRELPKQVAQQLEAAEADRPAPPSPPTEDDIRRVARTVADEAEAQRPSRLSLDAVRQVAAEMITAAEDARTPDLTGDDVRALVADAIARAERDRGPDMNADEVRRLAREAVAQIEEAAPDRLSEADVQRIAGAALLAAEERRSEPLSSDDVRSVAQEVLADAERNRPPALQSEDVRHLLLELLREREGATTLSARLEEEWAEGLPPALAVAFKELVDASQVGHLDELAVRTLARGEVAEVIAELPHPHTDDEIDQRADVVAHDVVRRALDERLAAGTSPVTPADVRRLAREIVAAEGATQADVTKAMRREPAGSPAPADLEKVVRAQVVQALETLGPRTAGGTAEPVDPEALEAAVRTQVEAMAEGLRSQLPAAGDEGGWLTAVDVERIVRAQLEQAVAEMREAGGGGGGEVDFGAVKRIVREIIEAQVPSREEVEKMIRRSSGGTRRP